MGIKKLHSFLKERCIEAYKEVHLSKYSYRKIAIDTLPYIYRYKATQQDRWMSGMISLILTLRKNKIHPVFVFDGVSPPEKQITRQVRKSNKERLEERVDTIKKSVSKYMNGQGTDDVLIDIMKKKERPSLLRNLGKKASIEIDIELVNNEAKKLQNQIISVTDQDYVELKYVLDVFDIPHLQAEYEAETLCAQLFHSGEVSAVISEDTDVLAYGVPIFISKISTSSETCIQTKLSVVLNSLKITYNQFRDFCILLGTDYNYNLPRIGPVKAFKLIIEHKSLKKIGRVVDVTSLNYKRVRELFSPPLIDIVIPFSGIPNLPTLFEYLFENGYNHNCNAIKSYFEPKIEVI